MYKRVWIAAILAVLVLAEPVRGAPSPPVPQFTLAAGLALLPDTPATRAVGVWYADYARAERVYNVGAIDSITVTNPTTYFAAIVPLTPGPETGASELASGEWRERYGYDLLRITSEIYTTGLPSSGGLPEHFVGVAAGTLDTTYIAHLLTTTAGYSTTTGYTATLAGHQPLFVRVAPRTGLPDAAMNAVALGAQRIVTGAYASEVLTALVRQQQRTGTLAGVGGYRALAAALGPVEGAYLAANVPLLPYRSSPFTPPPGGHRGPPLHPFSFYAVAYRESRIGRRVMIIALAYARTSDAQADLPVLRARLQRESLPAYGASWRALTSSVRLRVHGSVLLALLRLRPSTPATLWQDTVIEGDLSLLSQ